MLYVKIKSLNNFVKDGWTQRNDLFIIIKYKKQIRQTTIKWNDENPCWNEAFIFDYEEKNPDLIHFKIYDSNIFDKDIVLMEESSPVIMSKIQEYNIGNIKFDMGNPFIDTEKDKVIEDLKKEIINNKNHSLNIISKLSQKLEKIQTIVLE